MKSVGLKSGMLAQSGRQFGNVPWYRLGGVHPSQVEAVYVPLGAPSAADARINIAHPDTHYAIDTPAPGWRAGWDATYGWNFDGKGSTIDTTCVPASDWTMIVRVGAAWAGYYIHTRRNMPTQEIGIYETIKIFVNAYINNDGELGNPFVPNNVVGLSEYQGYMNGVPDGALMAGAPFTSAQILYPLYLGCYNIDGVPIAFASGNILAVAIYNTPLTALQMNLIMTAMNAITAPPPDVPRWWQLGGIEPARTEGVYVPIGAPSLAASYINIAKPGVHDAIDVPAPGYAPVHNPATGWIFDGIGAGIDTTLVPASNWTVILRYGPAWASIFAGVANIVSNCILGLGWTGKQYAYHNQWVGSAVFVPNSIVGVSKDQGYLNGVPDGIPAIRVHPIFTSAQIIYSIYLGCFCTNGVPTNFGTGIMMASAIYNYPLTPAQMALVMLAMRYISA